MQLTWNVGSLRAAVVLRVLDRLQGSYYSALSTAGSFFVHDAFDRPISWTPADFASRYLRQYPRSLTVRSDDEQNASLALIITP